MRSNERYLSDLVGRLDKGDLNPPGMNAPSEPVPEELQGLSSRQYSIYQFMESLVDVYSKFDQTVGPDAARYLQEGENPFLKIGLRCGTCVYFDGGGCDIVNGAIQPNGYCQYNLVPTSNMVEDVQGGGSANPGAGPVRKAGVPKFESVDGTGTGNNY